MEDHYCNVSDTFIVPSLFVLISIIHENSQEFGELVKAIFETILILTMQKLSEISLKIAVGLPAFNEEKNIASIIIKLQKLSYSVLVCNDGSSDLTGPISEKMGVLLINHSRNLGYGAAIRSLFEKAKEQDFDVLVTFDADGQHNVSDIKKVIELIEDDKADIVIGSRFLLNNEAKIPRYRKLGIQTITKLTTTQTNDKITDAQSGFRAYNKKALKEITTSDSGMGVSTEILVKAFKKKLRVKEIPINVSYEGETSTHNPMSHGISVILSTMRFISIDHPLKFYGIPGIVFLAIGLFFTLWTLQEFTISRKIITNIALIAAGATILGTVLLLSAILLYSIIVLIRERK